MKTPALTTLCLALAACGARGGVAGDAAAPDAAALGRRSFDVVATMTTQSALFPETNRFTLQIDPAVGLAIAGGGGEARAVALTSTDGRTFSIATTIGVGVSQAACSGVLRVAYERLDFTVAGATLVGRASGQVFLATANATPLQMQFEADLSGGPDTTPPFLIVPAGATTDDPLSPFEVWVSEPLPPTALARMVGGDGAVSGLVPQVIEGAVPLIASFGRPTVTLPPGVSFQALFSDDVIDLAGNMAPMGDALRLASVSPAPLLPADGFESATDQTFGGAAVVRSGPGILVAGNASVYIGQPTSPAPVGITLTPKLVVRMAVPAGATKLSFSYRQLGGTTGPETPFVQVGSVGRAPGLATPIPMVGDPQPATWGNQSLLEWPVATMTVPLPDELGPEVVVLISAGSPPCKPGFGTLGLVLDDLRIE